MPSPDPMGRGHAVALSIPAAHLEFLRWAFTTVRDGLRADLDAHPERLVDPGHSRRQADAFDRLLVATESDVCVPDSETSLALADLARSVDEANEYERVSSEHAALYGLLGQLDPGREAALGGEEG